MSTKSILTTYGNNRILDAIAQETTVPVTAIVYGDGDYAGSDPSVDQTALLHQIGKLTSVSKEFNAEDGFIYFKATIPANANEGQSFTLTEFGLLDDQNKVLTVTTVPGIEKPAAEDGVSIALPISIGFKTSTGEIMVVVEDGTDVYANTSLSNLNNTGEHHFDNTYATIDLENLSLTGERHFLGRTHITNCLTEVPQRIDYTLENGILTIKAGSIIIMPYGTTDLSSAYAIGAEFLHSNFLVEDREFYLGKFFVWARLQNDISISWNQGAYGLSVFVDPINNRLICYNRTTDASGSTEPSTTVSFYNTSTNFINRYSSGTKAEINLSFPVARITSNATQIVSVEEDADGTNHMGNTIMIDKDVRLLIPNGRNTNGSLNNIPYITEHLTLQSNLTFSDNTAYTYFYDHTSRTIKRWASVDFYEQPVNESLTNDRVYYDYATNTFTQYISSTQYSNLYCELGTFTGKPTYLLNFKTKYAFRAIDYNNFLTVKADIDVLRANLAVTTTTANAAKAKADTSVQLTGNQTVAGNKTFTGATVFNGTVTVPDSTAAKSAVAHTKIVTSSNGYVQLGNGLTIQWGRQKSGGHSYNKTYSLPVAFKSKNYKVVANLFNTNDSDRVVFVIKTQETSYFTARAQGIEGGSGGTTACQWIAVGY